MGDHDKAALLDQAIDVTEDLSGGEARRLRNAIELAAQRTAAGLTVRAIAAATAGRHVAAEELAELIAGFERTALEAIERYCAAALDDVAVARLTVLRRRAN